MESIDKWTEPQVLISVVILLIGAFGSVISLVWYVARWHTRMSTFKEQTEGVTEKFNDTIDRINTTLEKILFQLTDISTIFSNTMHKRSPRKLSTIGQNISEKIDAPEWAKKKAEEIAKDIPLDKKELYEIEKIAFDYAKVSFDPSDRFIRKMQQAAYEEGITFNEVLDVLALTLRDALLKNRSSKM